MTAELHVCNEAGAVKPHAKQRSAQAGALRSSGTDCPFASTNQGARPTGPSRRRLWLGLVTVFLHPPRKGFGKTMGWDYLAATTLDVNVPMSRMQPRHQQLVTRDVNMHRMHSLRSDVACLKGSGTVSLRNIGVKLQAIASHMMDNDPSSTIALRRSCSAPPAPLLLVTRRTCAPASSASRSLLPSDAKQSPLRRLTSWWAPTAARPADRRWCRRALPPTSR